MTTDPDTPTTIFEAIENLSKRMHPTKGECWTVETLPPVHLSSLFEKEWQWITEACQRPVTSREAETYSMTIQLDKDDRTQHFVHQLLWVSSTRRYIEGRLCDKRFHCHDGAGFTFGTPSFGFAQDFVIIITLSRLPA